MLDRNVHLRKYLRQQRELGMPDILTLRTSSASEGDDAAGAVKEGPPASEGEQDRGVRERLLEYYLEVKTCTHCPLSKSRKNMVFGGGKAGAEILVIGEAPGNREDIEGKPFVGRAGELLTKMLESIGLDRERDVFITNILKCRPPENRNPSIMEVAACMPILKQQVEILSPSVILVLGRVAAESLFEAGLSLKLYRGKRMEFNRIPAFVTYHPAALLRNTSFKRGAWEDLQKFRNYLKEKGIYGSYSS